MKVPVVSFLALLLTALPLAAAVPPVEARAWMPAVPPPPEGPDLAGPGCESIGAALRAAPVVLWTSCTMGPGSGLDADTLDGLDSRTFLDRDAALGARLDVLDLQVEDRAWASALARDGSGSGLDADRIDGLDSAQLLRGDRDATLTGSLGVTGRVGIGTPAAPGDGYALRVLGTHTLALDRPASEANGPLTDWLVGGRETWRMQVKVDAADDLTWMNAAGRRVVSLRQDGNVGIGATAPTHRLEVAGYGGALLRLHGQPGTGAALTMGSDMNTQWLVGPGVGVWNGDLFGIGVAGPGRDAGKVVITPGGDVGIGTLGRPDGQRLPAARLDVAGTVLGDTLALRPASLGTCDPALRGSLRFVAGGAGEEDALHLCKRLADATFAWVAVG